MSVHQQIFALIVALSVFVVIIDMVRKRRLREEYSVLWLATSVLMFVLVFRYEWLISLTNLIGAGLPTTTLFLFSIIFLMLLSVQFCIKISRLTDQLKNLSQENALMKLEIETLAQNAQHMHIEEQSSDSGLKPAKNP
jgi:hypothetical protein